MNDREIVELFLCRSEKAISETKNKYGKMCIKIASNILRNIEDTEECENDAYLVLWRKIPPEKPELLGAYLAKVVRNLALKKLEHQSAKKRQTVTTRLIDELSNYIYVESQIDEKLNAEELSKCINKFLEDEKYEDRLVFMRKYWFYDSTKDIAERYHMTESKVKGILFRSRKRLKKFLVSEGWIVK